MLSVCSEMCLPGDFKPTQAIHEDWPPQRADIPLVFYKCKYYFSFPKDPLDPVQVISFLSCPCSVPAGLCLLCLHWGCVGYQGWPWQWACHGRLLTPTTEPDRDTVAPGGWWQTAAAEKSCSLAVTEQADRELWSRNNTRVRQCVILIELLIPVSTA